jgi:Ribbon-helix-helix domain
MVRTQIQLTEEQYKRLKAMSHQQGISIAEIVRQSVDEYTKRRETDHVDPDERRRRAMAVAGRFNSGLSDISVNHDEYLAEAYMA